ncbi:MAG TPA: LUD domain-containing protein [Patescibacteria group bacterium]|nr:LUD domain-containing protein [Patescibacteria group bacterium]
MTWTTIPTDEQIGEAIAALQKNGFDAIVVNTGADAKAKVVELVPKGAEVMTMSSVTLETIGVTKEINESGNYDSVKVKLSKMDRATQETEMQKLGAAPQWAIGSVHGITLQGDVIVASNTGSQLPAYAYASEHVIWVVGAQKIVENMDTVMKRLYEYTLPLENDRMQKAHGMGSFVSKLLTFHREIKKGRVTIIFVKEVLGF